mmetsp:Transcript_133030/g.384780  ORF Transcript_133030/g.384780 Transcript_133030/m.384780 type:complete len:88 (-) Transcript_133030:114-377(-)
MERFEAPPEVDGFFSVDVGDLVEVAHPMEKPYVWAYAKRISETGECAGWLPEVVLGDGELRRRGASAESAAPVAARTLNPKGLSAAN